MNKERFLIIAAISAALVIGFMLGRSDFQRAPSYKYAPAVKKIVPKAAKKKVPPAKVSPSKVSAAKVSPSQVSPAIASPILPEVLKKFKRPRVAVVMDDFGYNLNDMDVFFDSGYPITLAILPNQRYSAEIAQDAHSHGYEAILHLPLEAFGKDVKEEPGTITTSMSDAEILSRLKEEIAGVPYIVGVSNHMGSKATEDKRVMSIVARELKRENMYFFDSLTSRESVAREASAEAGIRYGRRNIFLDIPNDPAYIEKQVLELRRMAFVRGSAIAVCHDRHNTIAVLKKMMPAMADDGIEFVFLSGLVK